MPGVEPEAGLQSLPFGKGELRREGSGIAILAFGTLLYPALQAAEKLGCTVLNMRWAKPLDTELLLKVAATHEALVTVEEGAIMGGAGSAVSEALQAAGVVRPVLHLGLRDEFTEHGDPAKLLALQGPGCGRHRGLHHCTLWRIAAIGQACESNAQVRRVEGCLHKT